MDRRGISRWATALAAVTLLGGCGGGGGSSSPPTPASNGEAAKPGPEVANDAANALQQTGAVHIKGTETEDGKPGQLDLRLEGENVAGTFAVGGMTVEVVAIGRQDYIKAPSSFWGSEKVPATVAKVLGDRWVKVPSGDDPITADLSFSKTVDEIRKPEEGTINPEVKPGSFNGQPTVVLTQSDGSTLDVAATGQPLPLHILDRSANGSDVALTDFGVRTDITAPAGALDLEQLAR